MKIIKINKNDIGTIFEFSIICLVIVLFVSGVIWKFLRRSAYVPYDDSQKDEFFWDERDN